MCWLDFRMFRSLLIIRIVLCCCFKLNSSSFPLFILQKTDSLLPPLSFIMFMQHRRRGMEQTPYLTAYGEAEFSVWLAVLIGLAQGNH